MNINLIHKIYKLSMFIVCSFALVPVIRFYNSTNQYKVLKLEFRFIKHIDMLILLSIVKQNLSNMIWGKIELSDRKLKDETDGLLIVELVGVRPK